MATKHTPAPWQIEETDEGHEIRMGSALDDGRVGHEVQHVLKYDHGLARANRPWSVTLSLPCPKHGVEQMECKVIDIGHSDRILLVECPELATLRAKWEALRGEVEALRHEVSLLRPRITVEGVGYSEDKQVVVRCANCNGQQRVTKEAYSHYTELMAKSAVIQAEEASNTARHLTDTTHALRAAEGA